MSTAANILLECSERRSVYLFTCFSFMRVPGWNNFTLKQIIDLFSCYFELGEIRHYSSLEGDGLVRFFYTVLMKKSKSTQFVLERFVFLCSLALPMECLKSIHIVPCLPRQG